MPPPPPLHLFSIPPIFTICCRNRQGTEWMEMETKLIDLAKENYAKTRAEEKGRQETLDGAPDFDEI